MPAMQKLNIPPQIIGQLYFIDQSGKRQVPRTIRFSQTWDEEKGEGNAVTSVASDIYGTATYPVFRKRNDRPLCIPGYAGLKCTYDNRTGNLKDFFEPWD